ncbi:hypothetical protein PVL30_005272 [Lodderomyces elongisporus]|uniref:uncharacterized protein n=1 Tax=Lodderomyces elongisporus TaxID=36914 RepID=UPI0029257D37|nr:uncharacterized protein PVL30_005272 [Lodderomyces elongisporus]WLF81475.1 hypothetical protein PVL30_005272 [Lodderomyces elongisporus]
MSVTTSFHTSQSQFDQLSIPNTSSTTSTSSPNSSTTPSTTAINTPTTKDKRKNHDIEDIDQYSDNEHHRKLKNLDINNPEWPTFHHPDGSIIKLTPWGSIKESGNSKVFQDVSFDQLSFVSEDHIEQIYTIKPKIKFSDQQQLQREQLRESDRLSMSSSVELLSHQSSFNSGIGTGTGVGAGASFSLSPTAEVEDYVMDGYSQMQGQRSRSELAQQHQHQQHHQHQHQQYCQEQENYFGMGDEHMDEYV